MTRGLSGKILAAPAEGAPDATIWCDYGFKWPAYTLVHLYRTEHPDNPFTGANWCVELAVELVDKCVDDWHYRTGQGLSISSHEVPHYITAALLEWLGPRLGSKRRAEWMAHAQAWAHQALGRPFGFTGNYHDAWRMLSLYRLGQALEMPEWCKMAVFFFHRMIALQTAEGFWEERRHHGPSMRYNGLMLPTLAWMYRLTGDQQCGQAARRLASFMATYSYPDAITVGPFDGRNSPMLAFFPICAGLEMVPEGRVLNARALKLWHALDIPEEMGMSVESTRDAVRLAFYAADTCIYLSEHVPAGERAAAVDQSGNIPVDCDGSIENHATSFDGFLQHQGSWVLALSGQNSDIPRQTGNIFRLERQSRIELWHQNAHLVLGGGHSLIGSQVPYANALLDTGYAGPAEFGRIAPEHRELSRAYSAPRAGGAITEASDSRQLNKLFQSYYIPVLAKCGLEESTAYLTLVFAHGTVWFRFFFPSRECCRIEAEWEVRRLERLCLQLPMIVWLGGSLILDGKRQSSEEYVSRELQGELLIEGGPFESQVSLNVPEGVPCRVHYPLKARPTFSQFFENDAFRPQFQLALVSCEWHKPARSGRAGFLVTVR